MLILGDHAIPAWMVGGIVLLVALLVRLLARRPVRRRRAVRRVLTWVAVAVVTVWVLASAAFDLPGTRHLVLAPAGPDGCRAAVAESAFLFAGSGTIYAGRVIGHKVGRYTADDGGRPISENQYELTWDADGTGVLVLSGTEGNPVYPGLFSVTC